MTKNKIKIAADELAIQALKHALNKYELSDICDIQQHNNKDIIIECYGNKKNFKAPSRIGEIIDQIYFYKNKLSEQKSLIVNIGKAKLNTSLGIFYLENGKNISLTEKEVEILIYLNDHKGRVVTREELLDSIWNYAKDVETHTIETHIYRLRQKIEIDPTAPKILITKENGYSI